MKGLLDVDAFLSNGPLGVGTPPTDVTVGIEVTNARFVERAYGIKRNFNVRWLVLERHVDGTRRGTQQLDREHD